MPQSSSKRLLLQVCAVSGVLLCASTTGLAGVITYATTNIDLGSGWRTSTLPKSDIDGNNVLGSDGWFVAGAAGSKQLAPYLSSLITNGSVYGGNGGYAGIDNPNTTPGLTPSTLQSGTLNPFPGANQTTTDVTFTFGANVPGTVRLGLMVDNLDIAAFNSRALQVVQVGGSGSGVVSTAGGTFNDRVPDWVYFDIQASSGETYNVIVTGGTNGCACLGAVSFDSVAATSVPEPSSLNLAGLGAAFLAAYSLRRLYDRNWQRFSSGEKIRSETFHIGALASTPLNQSKSSPRSSSLAG
ncbi:MAG: hypothetical protein JWP63_2760 [Candidatus Solibacter sp.]|nr:hypothetical protein [Candidatus Solibacter sp.]